MSSICFISTYLNHHNKPICDELFALTGGHFHYVATSRVSDWRKSMGFNEMAADYLIDYTDNEQRGAAQIVIDSADVVLAGASETTNLLSHRLKEGKLTFRISERLFKTRSRYLKAPIHWLRCLQTRRAYMLCSSAATARDYNLLGFYKNRCYKWGYFTEVNPLDPEAIWDKREKARAAGKPIPILWVGRLIGWKHPETAILALHKIKEAGYAFDFNLIGDGEVAPMLRKLVDSLGMNDCVQLLGAQPTTEVRKYMEECEIYLFTSNREEGWGAVLNESMSCACATIANSEIGAVPFLLKDGENGLIFNKGSVDSLYDCLVKLLNSERRRRELGVAAYNSLSEMWTPRKAAENLLTLVSAIQNNTENPIKEGPCSIS